MNTETKTIGEYEIPEQNLAHLQDALVKIGRRLARLGLPALVVTVGQPKDVAFIRRDSDNNHTRWTPELAAVYATMVSGPKSLEDWERLGRVEYRRYFSVTIQGQTPRLAGWSFVATLQHLTDEESGKVINMLRTVPSFEGTLPVGYRTASPENCDHCQKRIRTRKETFIVRHDDGTWKQIGRNCTQDFLGGVDPQKVAQHLELILSACGAASEMEEGGGRGGGGSTYRHSLRVFLAAVALWVRKGGWISRGRARAADEYMEKLRATADVALEYVNPPPRDSQAAAEHHKWLAANPVEQEDIDVADKALVFAREDLSELGDARNDYQHNLYVACTQSSIDHKLAGITASLIAYYLREVENKVLKEAEAKRIGDSQFIGQVGNKVALEVQVTKVITVGENSQWGPSYLHRMFTTGGNVVIWFSSQSDNNLVAGQTYWVKGTVKKHEDRQGVKQTTLIRLAVTTEEAVKAETEKAVAKAVRAAARAAKLATKAATL